MSEFRAGAVRYLVTDLERSVDFYTGIGFLLVQQRGPVAILTNAALTLWLSGPGSSGSRPLPDGRSQRPGGSNRLVLEVSEIESRIAELERRGVPFRNTLEVGPGGKQVQVEDPDGNPIELFEPASGGGFHAASAGGQAPRSSRAVDTAISE
ncbi:glyoxylase I family protein [Mycolicibacterium rutilum]|uniref:Glyoxylase I family protein n=1 Tax=Mycolicibacterium rutilum TaxID=370526 RepID=A0A1H6L6B0_MYCRU|nr:glyoxylase I family protein [Mycolicibacterium rutilum]